MVKGSTSCSGLYIRFGQKNAFLIQNTAQKFRIQDTKNWVEKKKSYLPVAHVL